MSGKDTIKHLGDRLIRMEERNLELSDDNRELRYELKNAYNRIKVILRLKGRA